MTQAIFLYYTSQDADATRRVCDALRSGAGGVVRSIRTARRYAWDASIRKLIEECSLLTPLRTDTRWVAMMEQRAG